MSPMTATEKTIRSGARQGEEDSASKPKATPGLVLCTKFRRPGIRTRLEPDAVHFSTACLLIWSAARMATARMKKSRTRRGKLSFTMIATSGPDGGVSKQRPDKG